ncbi:hypothetical protein, partial [Nocardia cyriacigeorgica]|uniref:hypothetical protein n=1 Tax=Nocardia cyriacigeorgica TaxID=135487 RepID=UPI003CC7D223
MRVEFEQKFTSESSAEGRGPPPAAPPPPQEAKKQPGAARGGGRSTAAEAIMLGSASPMPTPESTQPGNTSVRYCDDAG